MKYRLITLMLCAAVAGCSQTTAEPKADRTAVARATPAKPAGNRQERCEAAVQKMVRDRQNAAVAGSILSTVGGLGGFGGRGGMIAGQAAAVGGSIIQNQAGGNGLPEECS